jgi:CheY-like chemotaxis protein
MSDQILLAEDNPADVYLIQRALLEHGVGHQLQVRSDGREVLQIVSGEAQSEPDRLALIILDLNLPRHSGIEILTSLKANGNLCHIPVVVLTSSDSPKDRLSAQELGATLYLRKPNSLEEFLSLGLIFKDLIQNASAAQSTGC